MKQANEDIRRMIRQFGLCQYHIADAMHKSAPEISRKLRRELSPEEKEYFQNVIIETSKKIYGEEKEA